MTGSRAVVVGGGLAGLAAAVRIAQRGVEVVLLEGRPRLGGATYSFPRNGLLIDNGQHVLLRCYDEHLRFLNDIGTSRLVEFQSRFDIPVLMPGRPPARLYRTPRLPAPLHLLAGLATYRPLTPRQRLKVLDAARRLRFLDPDDPSLDNQSFGSWLRDNGQSARSVSALWDLFIVAALNTTCDEASLQLAVKVFRTALLTRAAAADVGIPLVPLSGLHATPAANTLDRLGAKVMLRTKATAVRRADDGTLVVATDGGDVAADVVVLATPHTQAGKLLPAGAVAQSSAQLGSVPILNAHFVFDRRVTELRFCAAVGSPIQWTFDRTRIAGGHPDEQYLAVSLSAAEELIDLPAELLRESLYPELARLFPAARSAVVRDFFVTRERHATFRQAAGCGQHRPSATTATAGLFLAGSWTATGWPDTMEGAVRSGNIAASHALEHIGFPHMSSVAER
ncbi:MULTISPECIES: hydroxysqualene dehydroxylase HpnE [Amycolatopsis]|uniref:Hydroxysqualene dehydroxylase HpnE n=1 Tax=Amycolatopsis albidoflavus TaxID=102226 RepID=A0ABW5I9R5_9PSEU